MPSVLTKKEVSDRLAGLRVPAAKEAFEESPKLWAYRQAAAVLNSFDPALLRPFGAKRAGRNGDVFHLIGDTYIAYNAQGEPVWSLRNDIRRAALIRLGTRVQMKRALAANPKRSRETLQLVFESYIRGTAKPLTALLKDELSCALQSAQWLNGILPDIPSEEEIRKRLNVVSLKAPFHMLTGEHFRGRGAELEALRKFVFQHDPNAPPYLAICGVGGAGKSTLISKFILDHSDPIQGHGEQLAFVYLDFDRPTLSADQPITVLIEALRQLEIQLPDFAVRFQRVRESLQSSASSAQPTTSGMSVLVESEAEIASAYLPAYIQEFTTILKETRIPRLLLVLDTFEEVQYQGTEYTARIYSLLALLRRHFSGIVAVLVSRAPLLQPNTETVFVDELDPEAALGFVESHGITDARVAQQIVAKIGGNPLSLQLAVGVVRKEGKVTAKKLFAFDVQQELLQGQLYRRILQHIHNPNVRKLAHPGLVVRKIDPDVILHVLARPCEVKVKNRGEAEQLFSELKREDALVQLSEDGAVAHRDDVRQVMLNLLTRDSPKKVRRIHLAAIKFYSSRLGTSARAEEIYHRLCLDQESSAVDRRWMDGIESHLRGAFAELPVRARRYLAAKLDIELDPNLWQSASLFDWEKRAEKQAIQMLRFGRPTELLQMLRERSERLPGSRLFLFEAQALQHLRQIDNARKVAEKGLEGAESYGEGNIILEYLSFLAALEGGAGRRRRCRALMDRALAVANSVGNRIRKLEIGVSRLILLRPDRSFSRRERCASQDSLAEGIQKLSRTELAREPDLAFDVAGEVGEAHPEVLRKVLRLCGIPVALLDSGKLLTALWTWDQEISGKGKAWVLANSAGISSVRASTNPWQVVSGTTSRRIGEVIQSLARQFPITESASALFSKLLRERASEASLQFTRHKEVGPNAFPEPYGDGGSGGKGGGGGLRPYSRERAFRRLGSSRAVKRKK